MALKRSLQEDIAQQLILDTDSEAHMSKDDISPPQSDSDTEEDNKIDTGCRDWTDTTHSRPSASVIHKFTEGPSELRQNEAPPLSVFMLFFLEIIQLLVEDTNRYYHQYLDT
jgi:hypothetical protein